MSQIAADALALPLESVRFELGDWDMPRRARTRRLDPIADIGRVDCLFVPSYEPTFPKLGVKSLAQLMLTEVALQSETQFSAQQVVAWVASRSNLILQDFLGKSQVDDVFFGEECKGAGAFSIRCVMSR